MFIWLDIIMNTIPFKNMRSGMLFTKLTKNQKLRVMVDPIEVKAQIPSELNAI